MAKWYDVHIKGLDWRGREMWGYYIANGDAGTNEAERAALRAFVSQGGFAGAVAGRRPCTEGGQSLEKGQ